jgi:signal transduction histidine kinase
MSTLNTCGLAYGKTGELEKAMVCYNGAEQMASLLDDKFWFGLINGNKARVYAQRGEIELAITALNVDFKNSIESMQWGSAIGSSIFLSELFIQEKDWKRGRHYLDTAYQLMQRYGVSQARNASYLITLSKILAHERRNAEAYQALLRHNQIQDSLEFRHQSAALTRIKTAFDIQQTQAQIESLTAENRLREQQLNYRNIIVSCAAAVILLLFILAFVIYKNYKGKKKDNYLLIERNNAIKAINEELRSYADQLASQNLVINKLNNDLEERVKKRTHQLQEANTELDLFLYGASHGIRSPITTLLGLGNLAHAMSVDKNAIQLFDKVMETAVHMDRMLYKLQMIYELNRPHDVGTPTLLTAVVQTCMAKFSREMKKIGMDCEIDIAEPILLKSEESLLSIIFQNLIENAIAFRKPDAIEKPRLWIKASLLNGNALISIRDNGIGIENDYIDRIFDLHFRGTALSHGNGLGLYLVKKALAQLKGRIEVISEYGVGTTFSLYFDAEPDSLLIS